MEIDEIVGYSSLVAAIAAVASAIVSVRNARISQSSVEQAQLLALKAERQAVVELATKIVAREDFIRNLANSAKQACQSSFVAAGAAGSSRQGLFLAQIDQKLEKSVEFIDDAKQFLSISDQFDSRDLDRMHAKLLSHSSVIESIIVELENDRQRSDESRRELLRSKRN